MSNLRKAMLTSWDERPHFSPETFERLRSQGLGKFFIVWLYRVMMVEEMMECGKSEQRAVELLFNPPAKPKGVGFCFTDDHIYTETHRKVMKDLPRVVWFHIRRRCS